MGILGTRRILAELKATSCQCGRKKGRNYAFCIGCWRTLPKELRWTKDLTADDEFFRAFRLARGWLVEHCYY